MACECVMCKECGGSGSVFYTAQGEYIGNHRCDDMDDIGACADCGGSGILDECDCCAEAREIDEFEGHL